MDGRCLDTVADIVNELDGPTAVGRLVGKSVQSIVNAKAANKLPSDTFLILSEELKSRGCYAPPNLWGIKQPERAAS